MFFSFIIVGQRCQNVSGLLLCFQLSSFLHLFVSYIVWAPRSSMNDSPCSNGLFKGTGDMDAQAIYAAAGGVLSEAFTSIVSLPSQMMVAFQLFMCGKLDHDIVGRRR
mmetsp:Transcript_841/g.1882  ORF Transcript_841/g.1882 Transcript_841/m.1882 type:complete len:108 (+) Transcript_841:157-480(+)